MDIRLRTMTENEFVQFHKYSTNDYAKDLMKGQNIAWEEAIRQAEKEFLEMLPEGQDSKDNALMIIEEITNGKSVGIIWYQFEVTDEMKYAFLSDFVINEEERRKGYATAALFEMEQDAKKHGCTDIRLHVWKHNPSGINLYTKCGYSTFEQTDGGMYMKKVIK